MMHLCHIYHSGHRHRNLAMLTADKSGSVTEHRYDNFCNIQIIQTYRDRHYVYDGIDRSDFMKMHLIHRNAVCLCLCFRQDFKNPECRLLCPFCDGRSLDDFPDFFHSSMLMVMLMHMSMALMFMRFLHVLLSMKIFHIMIVVILIQDHRKIAGIQS